MQIFTFLNNIVNSKLYPWILVGLLWWVGLLNYLDRQMLATMRPSMESDIPELRHATNFGLLMSVFLWVYGIISPVAGLIADNISKKWLIIISLFVWSGVTYGMGHATTYHQLFLLRALMGISEALYLPASLAMITTYHKMRTRSLAIGIHMTGLYLGSALGGFGATIASVFTWHFSFQFFGLIGIIYSLILIVFLKEKKDHSTSISYDLKPSYFEVFRILLSNLSFWIILLYFAVSSLPGWATKNWLPTLFSKNLGMPMTIAGPLSTITLALSSLIGVIFGGYLSDKWIQNNVKGRIYTGAIGLGMTIPSICFMGFGQNIIFLVLAGICFGVGYGMVDANNMPILCQFVSSKYRASAYGIMNMIGIFFGAYITVALGEAADKGHLGKSFSTLAVVIFLTLIILIMFLNPKTNDFDDNNINKI